MNSQVHDNSRYLMFNECNVCHYRECLCDNCMVDKTIPKFKQIGYVVWLKGIGETLAYKIAYKLLRWFAREKYTKWQRARHFARFIHGTKQYGEKYFPDQREDYNILECPYGHINWQADPRDNLIMLNIDDCGEDITIYSENAEQHIALVI